MLSLMLVEQILLIECTTTVKNLAFKHPVLVGLNTVNFV
uniref:Uncharacterized protein n=1 Tax=Lepeophtheirus salmonis TaxID=72036 RepID=A0A0K2U6F8_LEPSM